MKLNENVGGLATATVHFLFFQLQKLLFVKNLNIYICPHKNNKSRFYYLWLRLILVLTLVWFLTRWVVTR